MTALLVIITIIVAVAVDVLLVARHQRHSRLAAAAAVEPMRDPVIPQGLFLGRGHAWTRVTAEGTLRVGIDDLLAQALGSVDAVEIPAQGAEVARGEALITVRAGERTLTIASPVSGQVVTVNDGVRAKPWLLARDPYGAGWAVGIWVRDLKEAIRPLRVGAAATAFLRAELGRLVDFLTGHAQPGAVAVLADGGLPRRGALGSLDDGAWQAFEDEFLSANAAEV
jgi:glycine cleavage system H protein